MKGLLTGAAGFIGMHVAQLLARGDEVVGLDSLNDYSGPALKQARLAQLLPMPGSCFVPADLADHAALVALSSAERPERSNRRRGCWKPAICSTCPE